MFTNSMNTKPAPEAGGRDAETGEVRKKDLLDRVAAQAGVKRQDAKPVVEATLAVLGQALSDGEELQLQPLGKVMVNREKTRENGQVIHVKVRRSTQSINATTPLAQSDRDG
ncbi:HU family DNA-binding protein [Tranquillimonas alkanivorans]|uniref:DNA-binding protein HU-beta n=1 Tax=Tranquillimonas alkanivorans TaxID=441119 RepID=A0A1I5MML5_9RHOB|nr:HU family DNA-binding protein [Tranquillimonas alkanivorans]SFP10783.1 DNA-binding protein HU-beta [Tranquillimonas alkanivorans]